MRVAFAILVGLMLSSTALAARCPKACQRQLTTELRSCKAACPKRRPGESCRVQCAGEFSTARRYCRLGVARTPPNCGEATTTTATTTTTTTFYLPVCAPGQIAGDSCGECGTGQCFVVCRELGDLSGVLACLSIPSPSVYSCDSDGGGCSNRWPGIIGARCVGLPVGLPCPSVFDPNSIHVTCVAPCP